MLCQPVGCLSKGGHEGVNILIDEVCGLSLLAHAPGLVRVGAVVADQVGALGRDVLGENSGFPGANLAAIAA